MKGVLLCKPCQTAKLWNHNFFEEISRVISYQQITAMPESFQWGALFLERVPIWCQRMLQITMFAGISYSRWFQINFNPVCLILAGDFNCVDSLPLDTLSHATGSQTFGMKDHCGGFFHRNGRCPAKGVACYKCRKLNHFSKNGRSKQKVDEVYEPSIADECAEEVDDLFLGDSLWVGSETADSNMVWKTSQNAKEERLTLIGTCTTYRPKTIT